MAWYRVGTMTAANNSTAVTGIRTAFNDPAVGISPGDSLIVGVGTSLRIYEVASVNSATSLTLATATTLAFTNAAYQIQTSVALTNQSLAKKIAAAMDRMLASVANWMQILTGTGTVTITDYNGVPATGLAWPTMSANVNNALKDTLVPFTGDINTILAEGIYHPTAAASNNPTVVDGILVHYTRAAGLTYSQVFHTNSTANAYANQQFVRTGKTVSGVTAWTPWVSTTLKPIEVAGGTDANTLTQAGTYFGAMANTPNASLGSLLLSISNGAGTVCVQKLTYTTSGLEYRRTYNASGWSAWEQVFGSNNTVPIANGGTGTATPFGTAAGSFAQGNDVRLNSINGKSGGTITGNIVQAGGNFQNAGNIVTQGQFTGTELSRGSPAVGCQVTVGGADRASFVMQTSIGSTGVRAGILQVSQDGGANKQFIFYQDSGSASAPGTWINGSDVRHKSNIETVKNALAAVLTFNGSVYDKKDGGREVGLLAQQVERACKEAVTCHGDVKFNDGTVVPNFKYLNTSGASAAYHTEAIKTLLELVELALENPELAKTKIAEIKEEALLIQAVEIEDEPIRMELPPVNLDLTPIQETEEPTTNEE